MFDLNPWAARFARRFPKPALQSGEDKDLKHLFSTKDVTLPHGAVLREWYYGTRFAQSTPGVVTDTMGFTEVVSAHAGSVGIHISLHLIAVVATFTRD